MKRPVVLALAVLPLTVSACGSLPFFGGDSASKPTTAQAETSVPFQAPHLSFRGGDPPAGFDGLTHLGDKLLKASGDVVLNPPAGAWRLFTSVACANATTVSINAVQSGSPAPVPVLRQTPCSTHPSYLGEAVLQGSSDPITLRVTVPAGQQVWVSSYIRNS